MVFVLFGGLAIGITFWFIVVQRLKVKPWLEQGEIPASRDRWASSASKIGLFMFLGVVSSLFLLLTSAYFMRMGYGMGGTTDMNGMQLWVPLREPSLLWFNTAALVLASGSLQLARGAAVRPDLELVRRYFTAGGALTVLFLVGQFSAWRILAATGRYGPNSPAYAFFLLLTGVHALHLLGGLVVLSRTATRVWQGLDKSDVVAIAQIRTSVQLCAVYWHFLLLVWVGLFALLLLT